MRLVSQLPQQSLLFLPICKDALQNSTMPNYIFQLLNYKFIIPPESACTYKLSVPNQREIVHMHTPVIHLSGTLLPLLHIF